MKIDYPGLLVERLPSGNNRYRVRKEGEPSKRIRLFVSPDHPKFKEFYHAARAGIEIKPEDSPEQRAIPRSVSWLIYKYLEYFEAEVKSGSLSPKTLKKRRSIFEKILNSDWANKDMLIPTRKIIERRNEMRATPAAADDMVKSVRALYTWACDEKICDINPAAGISNIDKGKGGAKPWTVNDLIQFRERHPRGTTPHLTLTVLMFTACRIGDAATLGIHNEFERNGVKGIGWQPEKKNSSYVEIPLMPPLYKATRASNVIGKTYILNKFGQPFKSGESLGQRFRSWCREAELERSAHGVRKAAGNLLAAEGCTQYQIMSIHGHSQASTSEIYTKGVERWKLANEAMKALEGMDW